MPKIGEPDFQEKRGVSITAEQVGSNMHVGITEADGFYFEGKVTDSKPEIFVVTDKYDENRTRVYRRSDKLIIVQF